MTISNRSIVNTFILEALHSTLIPHPTDLEMRRKRRDTNLQCSEVAMERMEMPTHDINLKRPKGVTFNNAL